MEGKPMSRGDLYLAIAEKAKQDAERMKNDAGFGGRMDDGGAKRLTEIVDAWVSGLNSKVPEELQRYQEIVQREADPDWDEYQRLKRKFGD